MDIDRIWDCLSYLFVQQKCVLCDNYPLFNALWCGKCNYAKTGDVQPRYRKHYTAALAAMEYSGNTRPAMWRLKDDGDRRVIRFFAEEMANAMRDHWGDIRFDLLVPVPMNPSKEAARGYNQAALLAKQLAEYIGISMQSDVLARLDGMETQHKLSAVNRLSNAQRSYSVNKPDVVKGKTVVIVDDLLTTGATMDACSKLLLDAGANAVYVVAAQWTKGKQ